jgi:hypothetical protein
MNSIWPDQSKGRQFAQEHGPENGVKTLSNTCGVVSASLHDHGTDGQGAKRHLRLFLDPLHKDRQQTGESGTKASTTSWRQWEDSVVPAYLIELGQQALTTVTNNVAGGAPLVRCQLLASEFYEALKRELRASSELGVVERTVVVTATNLCCHAATATITPDMMLAELQRAIDLLRASSCDEPPLPQQPARRRPILCVIEGGLSKAV